MQTYDVTKVSLVFAGQLVDGYGADAVVKVSRNEDGWMLKMGNSGTGARARNPNRSGKYEFTLLMSSPANAILTAIALSDELSAAGVGEVAVRDRSTDQGLCGSANAWITKIPDFERAKEVGEITWVLESDVVEIFHDGTTDV
jgi:hypothetical protein